MSTTESKKFIFERTIVTIIIVSAFLAVAGSAAPPQVAEAFFGNVNINGGPAGIGTDVVVFSDGKVCGRFTVKTEGKYGLLACNDQRLKDVRFEINGYPAEAKDLGNGRVDLSARIIGYSAPQGLETIALILLIAAITYFILRERKHRRGWY